jgi:hypothetical protein
MLSCPNMYVATTAPRICKRGEELWYVLVPSTSPYIKTGNPADSARAQDKKEQGSDDGA